jgi:predicted ester cyclase
MSPEANAETVRKWLSGFSNLDDEAREKLYDECYAPNHVLIQGTKRDDKTGHLAILKGFEASFGNKDWETEIHDIVAGEKSVAALYTVYATQTSEFAGVASTGKERVPFKSQIHCFFNEDGKITDVHFHIDIESAIAFLTAE